MPVQIPAGDAPATAYDAVVQGSQFDAVAQVAAISDQPLIASAPARGQYRVTYSAIVTTAATTSSTLGGSSVTYTDGDTGASTTTATGSTNTGNVVGDRVDGSYVVYAQQGTAIELSFAYVSSGATAMAFAIHAKVEFLG